MKRKNQNIIEEERWVQCDRKKCQKWRLLQVSNSTKRIPLKWYCRMNTDKQYNDCKVPEQTWNTNLEYSYDENTTNGNGIDNNTKSNKGNNDTVKISTEKDNLNVSFHVEDNEPIRNNKRPCRSQAIKTSHFFRLSKIFWNNDRRNKTCGEHDNNAILNENTIATCDGDGNDITFEGDEVSDTVDHRFSRRLRNHSENRNNNAVTESQKIYNLENRLTLQKIHDSPHIYTIPNFLNESDLSHILRKIKVAETNEEFKESFIDVPNSGCIERTKHRTSTFMFFTKAQDSKISSIEKRSADLLGLRVDCIEGIQVVRYRCGEFFSHHHDLGTLCNGKVQLPPKSAILPPRRIVTIFVYLNDIPKGCGGSTRFPLLRPMLSPSQQPLQLMKKLDVNPKRGMALLFCNINRDGIPEQLTVHSGQKLLQNKKNQNCVKYGLNIWACEHRS